MEARHKQDQLRDIRAVVFDFDGTLAVLNIDFSEMREQVFELMRKYGVNEEKIEERYLLEIIDEVVQILNQRVLPLLKHSIKKLIRSSMKLSSGRRKRGSCFRA